MQGALLSIPVWDLDAQCGTVPSPAHVNTASIPAHANTVPTPTKNSPLDGSFNQSSLPSPLLNWRPNLNVPPPVLPPPPSTPTHHNSSPVGVSPPGHPSPCHNIHVQQKALLLAHQAAAVPVRQSTMSDFGSIDEYVQYLEREVGRVELVSFRVRLPNGQLALFESELPMRRRSIHSDSGLRVETDMTCADDVEDNALRNLSEWEEREAILQRQAMSMPDMRQYRHEVHAVTEPATLLADASFRSAATTFPAVAYNNGQMMPATVSSQMSVPMTPMTISSPGNGLQSLVAAANMTQQSPLLNMRPPFAPPLCPSDVLPPTPTNNPVRGYGHAATAPATVSNATTPLSANLPTPPDSPDFAEGSESPNSGCSTEADNDDDGSASGQRTSLKPSLPGCQHSAYWKRLRHKKGTTHFLCVLCGCKWRRVSRDGEE